MGKGDDAWLESLDEFKQLKRYEKQKEDAKNHLIKAERTVRGDWKPRQKVTYWIYNNWFQFSKHNFRGEEIGFARATNVEILILDTATSAIYVPNLGRNQIFSTSRVDL